jgi:hypothetical protein
MSKATATTAPAASTTGDSAENVKGAIHTGIEAIESTALAAAEIPLGILTSLGISEEAMGPAREGYRQLVHGIRSAIGTVADGVTDTTAGIATGITKGISTAASTAGDAASRMTNGSSSS